MKMTLEKVLSGSRLTAAESREIVMQMMEGRMSREEMAAVLSVMAYRGETAEEITGFAQGMLAKAKNVSLPFEVLDTCGTGGDASGTYNISTASAILLSSLGVKVAKHGNRSVSSKTGSADVLEKLGVPFQNSEKEAALSLQDHSLTFFYAPVYHEAMKNVAPVRKALKQKTIFNLLGPLTNPAQASRRVIGVYSIDAARKMAEASMELPIERALFVAGEDGMDEFTVQGRTFVVEKNGKNITEYEYTPEDAGLSRHSINEAVVNTPSESAALIKRIFQREAPGAAVDLLLLNAGAALYTAGKTASIKEGVAAAENALGKTVLAHLEAMQREGANVG
ncbi:anthranilate phosphoribosyltransferase [Alkalicoccus saliphilus]|uniref:Anthranilate phosphoribosyltransferase n=2 Tax=Alkalicoccus saliphilus TaxID=200989 RepID=A0A2T4UAD9_9BACI|nr:anthranilate phosphoribosyltransferase [Alkalicoccus saliphilus]